MVGSNYNNVLRELLNENKRLKKEIENLRGKQGIFYHDNKIFFGRCYDPRTRKEIK